MSDCQQCRSVKGFVIGLTLIQISHDGMLEGVRGLFMYPQQAFIKEVNKFASYMALCCLGIYWAYRDTIILTVM